MTTKRAAHLICYIENLGELPGHARRQGPWQVSGTGDIGRLKSEYRTFATATRS